MKKNLTDIYPLVIGAHAPVLRTVAKPVGSFTKEIRLFAHHLQELMWSYNGVGLAAPQVGQSIRMFAYSQRDTSKEKWELLDEGIMINPKLLHFSSDENVDNEACLSLPGLEGSVSRATIVTFAYLDDRGKQQVKKATGFNARILLHELDHLDGILFIDKAQKIWEKKGGSRM